MLVDVLVLVVLVDGHPHAADLGQHHLAEPGLHHQVDAGDRVGAQHHLVQLGGHPFDGDAAELVGHPRHRLAHPRRHVETELRDEPRRPQHPQRVVAEGHLRRRRACRARRSRIAANPPSGSWNSPSPAAVMRTAIALTVKSRRTRSSSSESPNRTSGLRDTWS